MVRTKGFAVCGPFLAREPTLVLSFSPSSSRLLRVLVVIGANREKTQQESSKRSKLDNENEHEDDWELLWDANQRNAAPAGRPIWSRIRWTRVATRSSTERACPFQESSRRAQLPPFPASVSFSS